MRLATLIGATLFAVACSRGSSGTDLNAPKIIISFFGAIEKHDTEGALDLLAEDFVFRSSDSKFRIDKRQFRDVIEFDSAVNSKARYLVEDERDGSITLVVTESNDFLRLIGIREQKLRVTFVIRGGKIQEEVLRELLHEGPSYQQAMEPLVEWAKLNRPEAFAKVFGATGAKFTGETAPIWLSLARAWRQATD
jgi:hypothetical protein